MLNTFLHPPASNLLLQSPVSTLSMLVASFLYLSLF